MTEEAKNQARTRASDAAPSPEDLVMVARARESSVYSLPVGTILTRYVADLSGLVYIECDGARFDGDAYPDLRAALVSVGWPYGIGRTPDLSGRVVRPSSEER